MKSLITMIVFIIFTLEQQENECSNFPWQFSTSWMITDKGVQRLRNRKSAQPPYSWLVCTGHRLWLGGTVCTSSAITRTFKQLLLFETILSLPIAVWPQLHLFCRYGHALRMIFNNTPGHSFLLWWRRLTVEQLKTHDDRFVSYHQCLWTDGRQWLYQL